MTDMQVTMERTSLKSATDVRFRRKAWDDLAENWGGFELCGTTTCDLAQIARYIHSPVIVIGSGHGEIARGISLWGHQVIGADWSLAMARQAAARRYINVVAAAGARLPFREGQFGTAIVPSGVLSVETAVESMGVLHEAMRVLTLRGALIAAFPCLVDEDLQAGRAIGYIDGHRQVWRRLVAIHRAGGDTARLTGLVARWTGVPLRTAALIVMKNVELLRRIHVQLELLSRRLLEGSDRPCCLSRWCQNPIFNQSFFEERGIKEVCASLLPNAEVESVAQAANTCIAVMRVVR